MSFFKYEIKAKVKRQNHINIKQYISVSIVIFSWNFFLIIVNDLIIYIQLQIKMDSF